MRFKPISLASLLDRKNLALYAFSIFNFNDIIPELENFQDVAFANHKNEVLPSQLKKITLDDATIKRLTECQLPAHQNMNVCIVAVCTKTQQLMGEITSQRKLRTNECVEIISLSSMQGILNLLANDKLRPGYYAGKMVGTLLMQAFVEYCYMYISSTLKYNIIAEKHAVGFYRKLNLIEYKHCHFNGLANHNLIASKELKMNDRNHVVAKLQNTWRRLRTKKELNRLSTIHNHDEKITEHKCTDMKTQTEVAKQDRPKVS